MRMYRSQLKELQMAKLQYFEQQNKWHWIITQGIKNPWIHSDIDK